MLKNKVLIVDDSLTNLTIISDILTDNGISSITEINGLNVEKILEENKDICLILLDIIMPKIDGYQICSNLKKDIRFQNIPVILLTGLESNENKIKGFESGAIDYITKPFNPKEVLARVHTHIELFQNRKILNSKIYDKDKKISELLEYIDRYIIYSQTDLKGNIIQVSQAFCDVSQFSKYELLNQPHNIVRHPDMPESAFKNLWETIQKGKTWEGRVKNKKKDNSFYWVYSRVSPQKDENDNIIGYTSIRQDITQQIRAEDLHRRVNNLLNSANEGFLSFNSNLLIEAGYSKKSLLILNQSYLFNKDVSEVLFFNDDNKKEIFKFGIKSISESEDMDTKELLLSLLPKENQIGNTIFTIDYKIFDNDFMIILSDVTEKRLLESKIEYENKIQKMIVVIATRKDEFFELKTSYLDFLENLDKYIDFSKNVDENISNITRIIHTFKGLLAQEELVNSPIAIHELENKILKLKSSIEFTNKELLNTLKRSSLFNAFDKDLSFISDILGKDFLTSNPTINIDLNNYEQIKQDLERLTTEDKINKNSLNSLLLNFTNINQKSLKHMLDIYPKRIKNIAERLNKEIHDIEIEGDSHILIPTTFNPFIQSLVHVFRNMIDHGIENSEERDSLKKDYRGKVTCNFVRNDESIVLTICDDGKGIDIDRIKEIAILNNIIKDNSLKTMCENDILKLIFHNNFTTTTSSDLLSGRGVGLYVVKKELEKIGGQISLKTKKNVGTKFIFTIPIKNSVLPLKTRSAEDDLSKTILDILKDFVKNDLNLEISNITHTEVLEIKDIYSIIKLNLHNNVFIILSIEQSILNKFLSFFLPDNENLEIDEFTISSVIDEILNIIMGHTMTNLPIEYESYELSTPLAMDKSILYTMSGYCETYNHILESNAGNINISILFSKS
jgi:two-component system chemotaxis sensor kinase CheA